MAKSFCQNRITAVLAFMVAMILVLLPSLWTQMFSLMAAAVVGALWLKREAQDNKSPKVEESSRFMRSLSHAALFLSFVAILLVSFVPELVSVNDTVALFLPFYQAGSLVFGGGHVVLPLLQNSVGSQLDADVFLSGYAAAQAIPGPMFTLAAFLGAQMSEQAPVLGAMVATIAIFLPGFLLVYILSNRLKSIADWPSVSGAVSGVNAAVVGLLLATLYSPVILSSVLSWSDAALVIAGFLLMRWKKLRVHWMVLAYILLGVVLY